MRALAAVVSTPEPEACAVIGCLLPRGESGFCKAHGVQRLQMIAAGRLHPQWVEGASPHSVPNVIPPRKRRGEGRRAASPAPEAAARPSVEPRVSEPRMWVRKKSDAPASVTPTVRKGADAKAGARIEPKQDEHQQIASTLGRWANEFKSRK
ncbi:cell wall protein [Pyxidicoccus trucidator]|uniref:cell wall protein n=1 Tax=Pyxidicoccus trucidator TaxID=2709662 RepID=UPI001F079D43|nr:cell wall protein [Pyxidicoccus trucidator]